MTSALRYEHVSAGEVVPDGSSEDTSTFELEIKHALEVTTALHLKMQMVVQKSSQNNSIKGELEEALYVALVRAPKISL